MAKKSDKEIVSTALDYSVGLAMSSALAGFSRQFAMMVTQYNENQANKE